MTTWTLIDENTGQQIGPVRHTEDEASRALLRAHDVNYIRIEETDDEWIGIALGEVA